MYKSTVVALLVILATARNYECTVTAYINNTLVSFESGTMPFERYDRPVFSIYGNLTNHEDPDVYGKIVTLPLEFDADLFIYELEQRGAIGVILMSTQLPVGWTFNFFRWRHQLTIPQVDVYYTDYGTISTALYTNVSVVSTQPNAWQVVFNRGNVLAMTVVFCPIFFVLFCISVWAFVDSVRSTKNSKRGVFETAKGRRVFWAFNYGLLAIECVFYFLGSIDYNGMGAIYGYLTANLIAFIPVELSSGNIFLFVVYMLDIMYKKTLSVTGFIESKALYISLAIASVTIGIISILLTLFIRGTLATAIPATMISGGVKTSTGILFIVVSSLLIEKCKKTQSKINKKMLYNWTILGVIIFLHGLLVLLFLTFFNSPVGNSIFYWLLRCFDASKTFCFLYPFITRRIVDGGVTTSSGTSKASSGASATVSSAKIEMENTKEKESESV